MRLHFGCGRDIRPGWVNVDAQALPGVDMVVDLEHRLPFDDDSVAELLGNHVLEHIREPLKLMQELHRVAVPGATLALSMPHGASDDAWEDPTHVRPYFLHSFGYFSQPFWWKSDIGYRGDWQPEQIALSVDAARVDGMTPRQMLDLVQRERNVVLEMRVLLTAVKPIRAQDRSLIRWPSVQMVPT